MAALHFSPAQSLNAGFMAYIARLGRFVFRIFDLGAQGPLPVTILAVLRPKAIDFYLGFG